MHCSYIKHFGSTLINLLSFLLRFHISCANKFNSFSWKSTQVNQMSSADFISFVHIYLYFIPLQLFLVIIFLVNQGCCFYQIKNNGLLIVNSWRKKSSLFETRSFVVSVIVYGNKNILPCCLLKALFHMSCTEQLGGPVLKASGRVKKSPFGLGDKSPTITDQHTARGSVSQLSQLTKLSPWSTLSTKDITTSFWPYNDWFCF